MFLTYKKKLHILMITIALLTLSAFETHAQPLNQNLNISAQSAILVDVQSGRILYEKNKEQKMRIASLTKIMTAIIAIENGNLKEKVITSNFAYGTEGSSIYLKKGEKLSLEDMLYGLILRSGNDAAVAIAEHIGGSVEGFAYLMNEKAAYLGMNHSHFVNPHGLDDQEHYSTAEDMAKLTAYALKNPVFQKIVSTKVKKAPLEGEPWDRKWLNKNKLLSMYPWADGVKTGYTRLAKRCLASSATKDGMQLAIITLNAPDDWNDHIHLFEYGFKQFKPYLLADKNKSLGKVKIAKQGEVSLVSDQKLLYPLKEEETERVKKKIKLNDTSPLEPNQIIGKAEFYLDDQYIGSVPIKIMGETSLTRQIIQVWESLWRGE